MAPLIQIPDPGEKLRQRYRLQRPYDGPLAPEIVPVVLVDDFSGDLFGGGPRAAMASVAVPTPNLGNNAQFWFTLFYGQSATIRRLYLKTNHSGTATFNLYRVDGKILGITEIGTKQWRNFTYGGKPTAFLAGSQSGTSSYGNAYLMGTRYQDPTAQGDILWDLDLYLQKEQQSDTGLTNAFFIEHSPVSVGFNVTVEWEEGQISG